MITTRRLFLGMVACLPITWQMKLGLAPTRGVIEYAVNTPLDELGPIDQQAWLDAFPDAPRDNPVGPGMVNLRRAIP